MLAHRTISTARFVAHPALLGISNFVLEEFDGFITGVGAASNGDGSLGDVKILTEELNQRRVGFAIVRFGAKVDSEFAWGGFDNLLPRSTWFDGYKIFGHVSILYHTYA